MYGNVNHPAFILTREKEFLSRKNSRRTVYQTERE